MSQSPIIYQPVTPREKKDSKHRHIRLYPRQAYLVKKVIDAYPESSKADFLHKEYLDIQ